MTTDNSVTQCRRCGQLDNPNWHRCPPDAPNQPISNAGDEWRHIAQPNYSRQLGRIAAALERIADVMEVEG
jgi:hypothetical protein